jgi:hypothetical protein
MFKEVLMTTYGPHVPGAHPIFVPTESNIKENLPIDTTDNMFGGNILMYLPSCSIL